METWMMVIIASVFPTPTMPNAAGPTNAQLRTHLADIRARIETLELELAALRVSELSVSATLDSIVYPVLTLPVEITREIFLHYAGPPIQQYPSQSNPNPLPLAAVCKLWRTLALSCSQLWPALRGRPSSDPEALLNLLQSRLSRVGNHNFRINMPLPLYTLGDKILPILAPYFAQLRSLQLAVSGPVCFPKDAGHMVPLSALEALAIDGLHDREGEISFPPCPKLHDVWLCRLTQISLPWSQLTFLGLRGQSLGDCLNILGQTSQLMTLNISSESDVMPPTTPLRLQHLRSLWTLTAPIIDHLILPALQELKIQELMETVTWMVHNLVSRSGCTLRQVCLQFPMSLADTERFILPLQKLKGLSLMGLHCNFADWDPFLQQIADGKLLPDLEMFLLNDVHTDIPIKSMLAMLDARGNPPKGIARLQSFRYSHWQPPSDDTHSHRAADHIRKLRERGMTVELGWGPLWFRENIDVGSHTHHTKLIIGNDSYFG
ncbi:hypothetical protein FB45DRAFT_1010471 [Roridomyces roridus]|uniref:F-box domain-containing protein n=1 Tax=Roridomyces roridus TaxID=1738132 RepID=A0AAD7B3A1_9AGAR|nr:hypothetical protein FB45DRAFT_1010471 [Roridomyces roridus]